MRVSVTWPLFLFIGIAFLSEIQARRIRLQPRPLPQEEAEETIQYYAAEPQEDVDNRQRVVLVSSADQYNGLYGQPTSAPRGAAQDNYRDNYIPRESPKGRQYLAQRVKETPKEPPVQTIRNYNKVNDDGSFTFGYEAADGSFKEETRGTDCVVRGKYGYVDPDGNKREFTYVSGNPCDPNAPKDEDDQASENESPENENIPANYPTRPIRPISRPVSTPKPAVTLFQTQYEQGEEEQPEPEQLLRPTPTPIQSIRSRPQYISRPQYVQQPQQQQITYQRPQHQLVPSSTPVSTLYRQQVQPVTITPRPLLQTASPTTATRTQLPATTFRPQIVPVSATPRPQLLYSPKTVSPAPNKGIDFDAEFQRFQQENNVVSPTPSSGSKGVGARPEAVGQLYSSALVYDPSTGQYKNQLYQSIPQTESDFSFNQRIQPYVHQQQVQQQQQQQQQQRTTVSSQQQRPSVSLQQYQQQYQQQSPLYRQQVQQINPQAVYQAQQAGLQFQNSAQLYAQQQKARQQQQQQQQSIAQKPATAQQPVYYIQPSLDGTGALGASQIDAFLRGHNIQY